MIDIYSIFAANVSGRACGPGLRCHHLEPAPMTAPATFTAWKDHFTGDFEIVCRVDGSTTVVQRNISHAPEGRCRGQDLARSREAERSAHEKSRPGRLDWVPGAASLAPFITTEDTVIAHNIRLLVPSSAA